MNLSHRLSFMTSHRLYLSLAAASVLALTHCASTPTPPMKSVEQPPIELSAAHPSSMDLKYVSISKDKKVTLRMPDGELATAHVGETFKKKDGTEWTGYTLKSVDRAHKKVVIGYTAMVPTGAQH